MEPKTPTTTPPAAARHWAWPFFVGSLLLLALVLGGCRERTGQDTEPIEATDAARGPVAEARVGEGCLEPWTFARPGGTAAAAAPAPCYTLRSPDNTPAGVPATAPFVLESTEDQTAEAVAALLTVDPAVPFSVEAVEVGRGPGAFRVVTEEPLPTGEVARFTLHGTPGGQPVQRWAFQVQAPLRILHTIPDQGATGVPVDAGIELVFSHQGVEIGPDMITVEPGVEGSTERHGRTWVFAPEDLEPGTLYTVRVPGSVGVPGTDLSLGQDFELQFETALTDDGRETGRLDFSHPLWESPAGTAPVFGAFLGTEPEEDAEVQVSVRRYEDRSAFLADLEAFAAIPDWASHTRSRFTVDSAGLETVFDATVPLQPIGDFGELVIEVPEALPEGLYSVQATREGATAQAWLQVTDVSAFAVAASDSSLAWVNDVGTGEALSGATIGWLGGETLAETDSDGVARFETPADAIHVGPARWGTRAREGQGGYLVTHAGREVVLPLSPELRGQRTRGMGDFFSTPSRDAYWSFLYTDRHLYRLTDTVHVWGVLRPRTGGPPVDGVTVEIAGHAYAAYATAETVLARAPLATNPAGTFLTELKLEGAAPGFYNLRLVRDGEILASTYLEVEDFVTPAYQIEVAPSQRVALAGESVDFEIEASFFEGSPVPNLELRTSKPAGEETVTTGPDGQAAVTVDDIGADMNIERSPWSFVLVSAQPVIAEEGEIGGGASVLVLPAEIGLEAESDWSDGEATVDGQVFQVDLDAVRAAAGDPSVYRGAPAPGVDVNLVVTRITYDEIEVGQRYDFISKRVVPQIEYREVRTDGPSLSAVSDAAGEFEVAFDAEANSSYEVEIRVEDDAGRQRVQTVWIWGGRGTPFPVGPTLRSRDDGPFDIGETAEVVMEDVATGDAPTARYLFITAQNGLQTHAVLPEPVYAFEFTEEHVPSITVLGVQFTGGTYQAVNYGLRLDFREASRRLTVDVSAEQDAYAPGDEATLRVRVVDQAGEPQVARVLLSAVDEAVLALDGGGELDILGELYRTVGSGIIASYASHQVPTGAPGAEGGGGGGGRDNFKDTALFAEVQTDAGGEATVSFDLPDNVTSWRVAAAAVTDDLRAGSGAGRIEASLPFFVDATLNDLYVDGDSPTARVRGFGSALAAGDTVEFEVSADGLLPEPVTVEAEAFESAFVPFGPVSSGRYEMRLAGQAGEFEDAVIRSVSVVDSLLMTASVDSTNLEAPNATWTGEVEGTVTVVDAGRGAILRGLEGLAWQHGDRLDQALAQVEAEALLAELGQTPLAPAAFNSNPYRRDDGGLALVPYGDSDLNVTVSAAAVAPDRFGRQALASYLTTIVDDQASTRERRIHALTGLAMVGEGVLDWVQRAAQSPDLTVGERLDLALGAAELGDQVLAAALLEGVLSEAGETAGPAIRIVADPSVQVQDVLLADTLAAARVAARLGSPVARDLYGYAQANRADETVLALDEVDYFQAALAWGTPEPASATISRGNETTTVDLAEDGPVAYQWAGGQVTVTADTGVVAVVINQLAPLADADFGGADVSLERSYAPYRGSDVSTDGDAVQVAADAVVLVQLEYDLGPAAEDGCYQITDILPSGLRPVTRPRSAPGFFEPGADIELPYAVEGQRVSFCVAKGGDGDVRYLARVVAPGTYIAGRPLIQSQFAPQSGALGEAATVVISE